MSHDCGGADGNSEHASRRRIRTDSGLSFSNRLPCQIHETPFRRQEHIPLKRQKTFDKRDYDIVLRNVHETLCNAKQYPDANQRRQLQTILASARLQAATASGPHVMAASRVGARPPRRVWRRKRVSARRNGARAFDAVEHPLASPRGVETTWRSGVAFGHARQSRATSKSPAASKTGALHAERSPPSLPHGRCAPPAGEAPPLLRPASAPGRRMRPCAAWVLRQNS